MMSSDNNGSRAKETNTADDLSAKSGGISIGIKNYGKVLIQQHYRCRADTNDNMGPQSCSMAGFAPFITNGSTTASGHKKAKKNRQYREFPEWGQTFDYVNSLLFRLIFHQVLSATGGGTADAVDWSNVTNKPETFAPSTHTHTASEVTELATVATSGSYNDLSDKPTDFAPAAHTHEMTDIIGLSDALDGKSDTTHNHDGTYLKEVPKATKNTLGVIKVGTGLSVTNDGTLSADAQAVNVTSSITQNSAEAVSSGAVFSRIGNLKFVVKTTPPTSADDNTFTIVVPN